jgi:hypothetical protein
VDSHLFSLSLSFPCFCFLELSGSTPRIYDELMPARGKSVRVIITKKERKRKRRERNINGL